MTCNDESIAHGPLGIVADGELLARVVNSNNLKKDGVGRFKNNLFPPEHIRVKGVSLIRADHLDTAELTAQGKSIAEGKILEAADAAPMFQGFATCRAEDIRAMTLATGSRSLCLVDSPVPGSATVRKNDAHSDAKHPVLLMADDPDLLEVQKQLIDLFVCLAPAVELKRPNRSRP